MSELSERFETHDPGEKQVAEKIRCDACPVMCYIADGRSGACDRYGNVARQDRAARPADHPGAARRNGRRGDRLRRRPGGRRRAGQHGQTLRHRDRRGHHLSRLQAGALHRQPGGRGRRSGDGGDRGHLLLLRRQGEDRHRPASRAGGGDRARGRRGGRPCDDRRIRLADAVARRRASPDRRLEVRGPRHLRHDAQPLQQAAGGADHRRGRDGRRAGGQAADHRRQAGAPHARRLRLGDDRHVRGAMARAGRRGRRGRRPHHRRRLRAPGGQGARLGGYGHQDHRQALDARPLFQGVGAGARLGRHDDLRPAVDPRRVEPEEGRQGRHVAA